MDIPALSIGMGKARAQQNVRIAVMKMAMDTSKADSTGLIEMLSQTKCLEMSVQPNLGGNKGINLLSYKENKRLDMNLTQKVRNEYKAACWARIRYCAGLMPFNFDSSNF